MGEGKGPLDLLSSSSHLFLFPPLDLTFLHEGSKTLVDGLVNIEKLVSGTAYPGLGAGAGILPPHPHPGSPLKAAAFLLGAQLA